MRLRFILLALCVFDLHATPAFAQGGASCCNNSLEFYSGGATSEVSTPGLHPLLGLAVGHSINRAFGVHLNVTHVWSQQTPICTSGPCGGEEADPLTYVLAGPDYTWTTGSYRCGLTHQQDFFSSVQASKGGVLLLLLVERLR
jgi:hypothetical protein